jgi:hypothetical protein
MNLDNILNKIIPPANFEHRNGFNNRSLIDDLSGKEKNLIEDALINKLIVGNMSHPDDLVIDTLVYLNSSKALPIFYKLLKISTDNMYIILLSSGIFQIANDDDMVNVSINALEKLDDPTNSYYTYNLSKAFYYLVKFKDVKINFIIKKYAEREEELLASSAKKALRTVGLYIQK